MRLSKLKLAGFKTFVDPTTVLTPGNLVGVVGPNGCGKSNIIDAVRWVLGESRASALRGESMQDVIFNGSTTRKPVSRASVELVFDNSDGKASGHWSRYTEISVKRVLDRSGESTYHINNTHVRRKDVIDLFLGTGLGPRAYAIIEQGMISRIIEAKPEEIRGFLEEAAGVTKYRERRRETEGRLSDARDNLARLDDIRTELGERIQHLDEQARVAARYRDLSATLVERQQLLWLLKLNEARSEQRRIEAALDQASRQLESDNARLQELERALGAARENHHATSEATHAAQGELFAASAEVSRLESELRHLDESRKKLESRLADLAIEHTHWQTRKEGLESDAARWAELLDNARARAERAEARHEEVAARLPELESARQAAETTVAAIRRELAHTEQQLRVEEARRTSAERALDVLKQRRDRLEQEHAGIVGPDRTMIAQHEARVDTTDQQLAVLQGELADAQACWPDTQAALKRALDEERTVQRSLTELRAHRDALVQLQSRVQAQGKLGDWLQQRHLGELPPLWQALEVESGWETALEAALGNRLGALTGETLRAVEALLDDAPPESLTIVLETTADRAFRAEPTAPAGAAAFIERIRVLDDRVRTALQTWLTGCFVVESIAPWIETRERLAPGTLLVDRAGRILGCHSLSHHAPEGRTHGVLERQREIDALTDALKAKEDEARQTHDGLARIEAAAEAQQEKMSNLRRDVQATQQQLHSEQVTLLKLVQTQQRTDERIEQISSDLADLTHLESAEREHIERAGTEHARCAELAALQNEQLDAASHALSEQDQLLREGRALDQAASRELQEARFSERECVGKLEDVARNQQLAAEQLTRIAQETESHEQALGASDGTRTAASLQEALALRQRCESALAACRDAQESAAASLKQVEETRLATEHQAVPLREQISELRLAAQAAALAADQFEGRLTEAEARIELLQPLLTDDIRETALQREVGRLTREIEALGAVNLAALDELRSAQERKSYLDAQDDDLTQAITTLEDAIRRIDRETREQLQETYDTVNRQFGTLFPQLFGGGKAALVLTGEEILDAGIQIVAQPPGKKNTSIHLLSGGEKALTAIALVFSMFQLNPAPFCMLDEVDAPLDDANTERYCRMVESMSLHTQFVFISHSKVTMEIAKQLVGVTMQEQGVSRVVEVDMDAALRMAESTATA